MEEKTKITGNEAITPHLLYNEISGNPNGFVKGMNLRQLFATNAQKAIISNADTMREITNKVSGKRGEEQDAAFFKVVSTIAVLHADALIEALSK